MEPWQEIFVRRLIAFIPKGQQNRVSASAGLSAETISKWKNNKRPPNPRLSTLVKLATAIGVPVHWLLTDDKSTLREDTTVVPVVPLQQFVRSQRKSDEIVGTVAYPTEWLRRVARPRADLIASYEDNSILLIDRSFPNEDDIKELQETLVSALIVREGTAFAGVAVWLPPVLYLRRTPCTLGQTVIIQGPEVISEYIKGKVVAVTGQPFGGKKDAR